MSSPQPPKWLKPIVELSSFGGDPVSYINHLHTIFENDFLKSRPSFEGAPVLIRRKESAGKRDCFWHLTSGGPVTTASKGFDMRRSERISWVRPIIENCGDPAVLVWKKDYKGEERPHLFLKDHDFLVVLIKSKYGHYLVTAHYIDYNNRKERLIEEYNTYTKLHP